MAPPKMPHGDPPGEHEIEISVFGPGYGECVVLHAGGGEWIVVDSCLDPTTQEPVALQYLRSCGVDVGSKVLALIVTHWHDDHIRGAAKILREAHRARFVCSVALGSREFLELIGHEPKIANVGKSPSGISEFAGILEIIARRNPSILNWALENTTVLSRPEAQNHVAFELKALSPSSSAVTRAMKNLGKLIPPARRPANPIPVQEPNDAAVVLHFASASCRALLGADLETGSGSHGWSGVIESSGKTLGNKRAAYFKVAHHGSASGDHPGIWTDLLDPKPRALITAFRRGRIALPTGQDIQRIRNHAGQIYCSSNPESQKRIRRDAAVERTIKESGIMMQRRSLDLGLIRLRASGGNTRVDLFGAAYELPGNL